MAEDRYFYPRIVVELLVLLIVAALFGPSLLWSTPLPWEATKNCVVDQSAQPSSETQLRQKEAEQLRALDDQLRNLDGEVADGRQRIEAWYTQRLGTLKSWAEQRYRELDEAERVAYLRSQQQMRSTESVTNKEIRADEYTSGSAYISRSGYVYGSGQSTVQGYSSERTNTRVKGDPVGEYSQTAAQIEQARRAVEEEFTKLRVEKERASADLDSATAQKRTTLNWHKDRVQRDTQRQLSQSPNLEVAGVGVGADNKPYAIIGDTLVHEGNLVNGYTVRKITGDRVELVKDGRVLIRRLD